MITTDREPALAQRLQLLDVQSFTSQFVENCDLLAKKEKKEFYEIIREGSNYGDDFIDIRHEVPLKEAQIKWVSFFIVFFDR